MKNTRLTLFILALLATVLLAACGNKGDLVHPDESADASAKR